MKASIRNALTGLPAAPTVHYPEGAPFVTMMADGTMEMQRRATLFSSVRTSNTALKISALILLPGLCFTALQEESEMKWIQDWCAEKMDPPLSPGVRGGRIADASAVGVI